MKETKFDFNFREVGIAETLKWKGLNNICFLILVLI